MFKRTATDLDTQPTTKHRRMKCALKNARQLLDDCCCLNDKGNEILFRTNISPPLTTIAGLDGADQCLGLQGRRTSHQWITCYGAINPLNAELNPICHLVALVGAHSILHVSRIRAKALIYTSPFDSEEDLIARIVEAAATIRQQPGIFECTSQTLLLRCRLRIEVGGRTCEYLL
jgi:hypothetical protein